MLYCHICKNILKKTLFILLKIGQDHIMEWHVDSFKEETWFMVLELTEGLQIEMCHLLSYLHQHIKNAIVYFA